MSAEFLPAPVRATLTVLMAGSILLSGCTEQPQWEDPQVSVSASAEPNPTPSPTKKSASNPTEACRNLIDDGAKIEPWECEPLPRIKTGDFSPVQGPMRNARLCKDYGVVTGYTSARGTNLSGLPGAHAQAVNKIMQNPTTQKLSGYAEGGVYFSVTLDLKGLDAQYTEVKNSQVTQSKQDVSEVCFGRDSLPVADLHATLNHEGGHALYSQVVEVSEGKNDKAAAMRAELTNFRDICEQEFVMVVDEFRASQQQPAQAALAKLRAVFVTQKNRAYIAAVDELTQRFATPNGLQDLLITTDAKGELGLTRELDSLIDIVKARQENTTTQTSYADTTAFSQRSEWVGLSVQYSDYLLDQFGYMLEGVVLKGVAPREAGHTDTLTGNLASGIASTLMHPQEVIRRMNALPLEQRRLAVQKFGAMQRLVWALDPKLAEQIHFSSIAANVNVTG